MTSLEHDDTTELRDPLFVVRARGRLGTILPGKWHLDTLLRIGGTAEYAVVMGLLRGTAVETLSERHGRRLPGEP